MSSKSANETTYRIWRFFADLFSMCRNKRTVCCQRSWNYVNWGFRWEMGELAAIHSSKIGPKIHWGTNIVILFCTYCSCSASHQLLPNILLRESPTVYPLESLFLPVSSLCCIIQSVTYSWKLNPISISLLSILFYLSSISYVLLCVFCMFFISFPSFPPLYHLHILHLFYSISCCLFSLHSSFPSLSCYLFSIFPFTCPALPCSFLS